MAAGFRTRRIKTENSLGDKLKKARTRKKLTVAQAEETTRIRAKFILALESDSWEQIPCEAYGRGYLEAYSDYLGLDVDAIMKQYGRERELYARSCQDAKVEFAPPARLAVSRFFLSPKLFMYAGAVGVLALGGGLAGLQLKRFSSAPYLELVAPVHADDGSQLVVLADSINLSGRTAVGASVEVNGRQVAVDGDGQFQEAVALQKGDNAILVEAVSGTKRSSEIVNVVAK